MLAIKLGFADPEPADSTTGYQRLMHGIAQSYFRTLFGVGSKRQSKAGPRSRRKECISCSPARAKITMPTGM
jgi:hypothetical protein